ncbi:MAG: hypothetical protein ACXWTW_06780 [Methylobacter sp.]
MAEGNSAAIVAAYQGFLDKNTLTSAPDIDEKLMPMNIPVRGQAHLLKIRVEIDGQCLKRVIAESGHSILTLHIDFAADPALPCPNVAITLHAMDGRTLTSTANW